MRRDGASPRLYGPHIRRRHESAAYVVESAAIDLLQHVQPGTLLNAVGGHHGTKHGLVEAGEVEIRYAAKPMPDPGAPVVLTSLDQTWSRGMSGDDLLEFAVRWWRLSQPRNPKPEYVFGVHRQIVRSAYKIVGMEPRTEGHRGWQDDLPGKPRRGFVVVPAPDFTHMIGTTALGLLSGNPQWSVRYLTAEDFRERDSVLAAQAQPRSSSPKPQAAASTGSSPTPRPTATATSTSNVS